MKEELALPAFTTDLIVGFPGETEKDFEDSLDTCRQIGFSKIHMFPFSARRGTPAAEMDDQIPKAVKTERGKVVQTLENELRDGYYSQLVGQRLRFLAERYDAETQILTGTSCRYAPVAINVSPESAVELEGQLIDVVGQSVGDKFIVGKR